MTQEPEQSETRFTALDVGPRMNFADIDDLIAVSNGEMSTEEAERRYQVVADWPDELTTP